MSRDGSGGLGYAMVVQAGREWEGDAYKLLQKFMKHDWVNDQRDKGK